MRAVTGGREFWNLLAPAHSLSCQTPLEAGPDLVFHPLSYLDYGPDLPHAPAMAFSTLWRVVSESRPRASRWARRTWSQKEAAAWKRIMPWPLRVRWPAQRACRSVMLSGGAYTRSKKAASSGVRATKR